jgi:putative ABC transport system permease protein
MGITFHVSLLTTAKKERPMLKNYFTIAIRNLWKQKGYSFINVAGLSIGIAAAILISLYASNELTYESFHKNADDLYLVYKERITPAGSQDTYDTWVPLKNELEETYPNVIRAARTFTGNVWVEAGGKHFQETVVYTDAELFEMFTFPLIKGNNERPFPSLQSIVISQDIAHKYFGNEDPIDRVLRLAYARDYVVSGVLEKIPQNSSIQIDMAVQLESASAYENVKDNWSTSFLNTYIQLREENAASELVAQFPAFIAKIWNEEVASRTNFKLLPVTEMYNRFNDSDKYAYILLGIAFAIMVIACINFMNMATARSLERAREVGMRKALGGQRSQLVIQFLGESVLVSVIALLAGIAMTETLLPAFNNLYSLELSLTTFNNAGMLAGLIGLGVFIGMAAGSYPALYLSKFSASEVLRGQISNKPGGLNLRRVLVSTQFAVTIVIIIGTLIMYKQVQFMKHADLGLQKENVIAIERNARDFENSEDATIRLRSYKEEILKHRNVIAVASSGMLPGDQFSFDSFTFVRPEGLTSESPLRMRFTLMDSHFFDLFEIVFLEGRNFLPDSESDRNESVVINRAARDDFGWESAVGKPIRLGSDGSQVRTVIGVVENYHYQSLENEVAPVLHFYRPSEHSAHNFISVKVAPGQLNTTLQDLEASWNEIVAAAMPINYSFVDERFDRLYRTQDRLITVTGAFSVFAILIASLGLLALSSLMITQRTKEIGIRKVLGATVTNILTLLSKDFLKLVVIGFVIAIPIAWYAMNRWLEDFAYRIEIGPDVFVLAGLAALLIALITVTMQAIRAAVANPVEALRYE